MSHLPRFDEQAVRESPLLELYFAGMRFRKALDTAVTDAAASRVRPDIIDAFKAAGGYSLAHADTWLTEQLHEDPAKAGFRVSKGSAVGQPLVQPTRPLTGGQRLMPASSLP